MLDRDRGGGVLGYWISGCREHVRCLSVPPDVSPFLSRRLYGVNSTVDNSIQANLVFMSGVIFSRSRVTCITTCTVHSTQ